MKNDGLISRQAAIDTIHEMALALIKALPSVQPEIIMCKDCKHYIRSNATNLTVCNKYNGLPFTVEGTDFCSRAERRTDGTEQP